MRPGILFIALILHFSYSAVAQPSVAKVDSLIHELENAKPDTNKYDLLQEISSIYFQENPTLGVKYGKDALKLANEMHDDKRRMRGNNLVARCYAVLNNLPEALKYFQAGLDISRQIKNARFEGVFLSSISAVYATNDDYDKALQYAMQAKSVNEKAGIKYMVNLMTNIGYLYIRQEKFSEALKYYEEGLKQALDPESKSDTGAIADLYLNRGGVYIRVNNCVAALEDYIKARNLLQHLGHTQNLSMAIANIGESYLRIAKGKNTGPLPDSLREKAICLQKAKDNLEQARALAEQLQSLYVRSEVYSSLSDLYVQLNQYEAAYKYMQLHYQMTDSLHNADKEKEFARMEAQLLVKKQTDSLNYLNLLKDKEIKQHKTERNGAIAVISLAGIISLLIINRQKLKHLQKRKMAEAETKRITELAKQQLDDFTRSIQEKNDLIDKFSDEIAKYQALPCSNELPGTEHSIQSLQNAVILTEEQWINFQSMFDKVHTGYINRVKMQYPDLTAAELRYMVLTKLGLANKEMASMMGVSLEAIRVNKHRLIKKIQLSEGENIEDIIKSI